eukprot:COSAG02_NODE_35655_length_465_cov_0.983607_1_plen_150_part_01
MVAEKAAAEKPMSEQVIVTVSNAGTSRFDGGYVQDVKKGELCERPTYRKIGGDETLSYEGSRWWMTVNYGKWGWYYVETTAQRPPAEGWKVGKRGIAPAPTLTLYEEGNGGGAAVAAEKAAAEKPMSEQVIVTVSNAGTSRFDGGYVQDV